MTHSDDPSSRADDPRPLLTLQAVAEATGGRVMGDPRVEVRDLLPLEQAGEEELGFLADRRYLRFLSASRAGALLVGEALADRVPGNVPAVAVSDPHRALAILVDRFHPRTPVPAAIHPTAVFGTGVRLGEGVSVGPYVVVGDGAVIGDRVVLSPHVVVGARATIGDDSVLHPHVVLYPEARIGKEVVLHAGVKIGVDGFGYVFHDGEHRKVPQVGGCEVGDRVEIGANTCLDRGSIGRTVVGEGTKIDNLVHLGHNVVVGPLALLVAQVGIAGSSRVGKGAVLGGQVGVSGHLEVGDGARLGAQAGVIGDVPAGETVSGYPARPHRSYLQAMAALFRLPDREKARDERMSRLEDRIRRLEEGPD